MKKVAIFGNAGGGKSTLARKLALERFAAADTLVYVDLPLTRHYLWVTKRLVKGLFVTPEGWPERSPILSSTLDSYRVIRLYNRHLAPKFREYVSTARSRKQVHHLRSVAQMKTFLQEVHASTKH